MVNFLNAMGVSSHKKEELADYHLKDVAQVWYEQWKDERPDYLGSFQNDIA